MSGSDSDYVETPRFDNSELQAAVDESAQILLARREAYRERQARQCWSCGAMPREAHGDNCATGWGGRVEPEPPTAAELTATYARGCRETKARKA